MIEVQQTRDKIKVSNQALIDAMKLLEADRLHGQDADWSEVALLLDKATEAAKDAASNAWVVAREDALLAKAEAEFRRQG